MTDTPDSYAKRISSYPPDQYQRISGTYSITEDSKMLEMIAISDTSEYDFSKWENVGLIVKDLKTWQNLPAFIQKLIQAPLTEFIRINFPISNEQLRKTIWDLAIPHLKKHNLEVEVEEAADAKNPGRYSVIDIRIVRARRQAIQKSVAHVLDGDDDERETMPDTPISKILDKMR